MLTMLALRARLRMIERERENANSFEKAVRLPYTVARSGTRFTNAVSDHGLGPKEMTRAGCGLARTRR